MEYRTKRLGVNTLLVLLGKSGSSIIGLLMLPFYTRWLSTADYGTTDLVFTYTSIIVSVISCCIYDAIFIYAKNTSNDERIKYFTSGLFFLLLAFLIFLIVTIILYTVGCNLDIKSIIFKYAWFIFAISSCNILQLYTQSFTQAIDQMKVYTLTGVVFTIAIALCSIILLPLYGLDGYLWCYVLSNIIATAFSLLFSKSYRYINIHSFNLIKCRDLLSYGVPLIPNTIMWWLVSGINRPIMESTLGLSAIGIFAVSNKIPSVISMLCGIFNTAWSITMLEEYGKEDFNHYFNKIVKMIFFVLTVASVFIAIFSKTIVSIFAASEFYEAWKYIPFLVFGVLLQNLSGLIGGVFAAQKKSKYFFYSSIWGACTSLIFTLLLISIFGIYGVCLSMILSFLSMIIARLRYAWQEICDFDIKYYVIMSMLYILISLIVISSLNLSMKILLYIIVMSLLLLYNRCLVSLMLNNLRTIIKNKKR